MKRSKFGASAVGYHEAETSVFAFLPCFLSDDKPHSSHFTAAFWNQQIDGPMASHAVSRKVISWLHFSNVFWLQKGPHWVTQDVCWFMRIKPEQRGAELLLAEAYLHSKFDSDNHPSGFRLQGTADGDYISSMTGSVYKGHTNMTEQV